MGRASRQQGGAGRPKVGVELASLGSSEYASVGQAMGKQEGKG